MIEKLRKKIFLIVFISFSIILLGIIMTFAVLNYRNTINTAVLMINRINSPKGENIDIRENKEMTDKEDKPFRLEEELRNQNIEGMYFIRIEDGKIVEDDDTKEIDSSIKKYAMQIYNEGDESGIIDKYVYRTRRRGENNFDITFMENEDAIARTYYIIIISVALGISSIIIVYFASKKLSKILVKPVEETFEKQKQFISDASHELKTPLAVIEANAEVLENENDSKWIKYIKNETESMDKLINELLMLAKIENIDNLRELKEINLSKEIEITISMFESMAYEKNVKLNSNIKENISLKASKEDIEHIVSTLLDNAIKHTEKEVEVNLQKEKNDIIIEVKNYGEEIPVEEREKIFERFYRIDKSRNRKEKRYGLGLSIAKSIVEKYDGKIEVLYKDHFTIFKVVIPN